MLRYTACRLQLAIAVLTIVGFASASPVEPNRDQTEAKPTPWINAPVVLGEGFAGVRFGDPTDEAERTLGEPDSGYETARTYGRQGFEVKLYGGRVTSFSFYRNFRGRLVDSGIAMGDSLADVQRAYGSILERREVDVLWDWTLHRVLLVRRDGPVKATGILSRLCYEDRGLCFYLDSDDRIVVFLIEPKRPVSTKEEKNPAAVSEPAWFAIEPIREREGFAGVRFGDSPARVEEVLGDASCGSDTHRHFTNPDIQAAFEDGRLLSLRFGEDFRGRLSESGIGMGDTVEDVLDAYGEPLGRREVEKLSAWNLDQVLIKQRSTPGSHVCIVSKLMYRDAGIEFSFDKDDRVAAILLSQPQLAPLAESK
jgi:hypothetical protein